MPLLTNDSAANVAAPVHLLLIGDSKAGKSTYAAEAVIDGFNLIYIDIDNGLVALRDRFKSEPNANELLSRVNYFNPRTPIYFLTTLLRSTAAKPMLWMPNRNVVYKPNSKLAEVPDNEPLWVIMSDMIPPDYILCVDSWTSLASDGLQILRPDQNSRLIENEGQADQSLYGEARIELVYITNMLQRIHCHVIVQAHSTRYEIWEKPKGAGGGQQIKQKDMTLVETIDVPVSSSRAHGLEMASRFNHIGRLEVGGLGVTEIDFTRHRNKVGGGPPNRKSKTKELRFLHLVAASGESLTPGAPSPNPQPWYQETTVGEFAAALAEAKKKS